MLSSTRSQSQPRYRQHHRSLSQAGQSGAGSVDEPVAGPESLELPSELLGNVFEYLSLKDLLPCRRVSPKWRHLVDTEAKLRLLEVVCNDRFPLVFQAGAPYEFDISEYLTLSFDSFSDVSASAYPPSLAPVVASLTVTQAADKINRTSMGSDEMTFFQNVVLSVTRLSSKGAAAVGSTVSGPNGLRPRMFGVMSNWEIARETDRFWREWWDGAPSTPFSLEEEQHGAPAASLVNIDSGFAESTLLELEFENKVSTAEDGGSGKSAHKTYAKSLELGKTIYRATMELSCSPAASPSGSESLLHHEYRWRNIELDVYRVIIGYEDRSRQSGATGIFSPSIIVF